MSAYITAWIRHGHYHQPEGVPSAHLPHPLTELGETQAEDCARMLGDLIERRSWTLHPVVDTSRLLRAWQTGKILADALTARFGIEMQISETDALAERCVGSMANLTVDQIAEIVDKDPRYASLPDGWKSQSDFRLPFQGAESMLDAGRKVAQHVASRVTVVQDKTLKLIVGHGGAFRHAAVHLGLLELDAVPGLSMWHCSPVFMSYERGHWTHLEGDWKVRDKASRPD